MFIKMFHTLSVSGSAWVTFNWVPDPCFLELFFGALSEWDLFFDDLPNNCVKQITIN